MPHDRREGGLALQTGALSPPTASPPERQGSVWRGARTGEPASGAASAGGGARPESKVSARCGVSLVASAGLLAFEAPFHFGNFGFHPQESILSSFFGIINEHALELPHGIRLRFATFYLTMRQPTAQNDFLSRMTVLLSFKLFRRSMAIGQ